MGDPGMSPRPRPGRIPWYLERPYRTIDEELERREHPARHARAVLDRRKDGETIELRNGAGQLCAVVSESRDGCTWTARPDPTRVTR